MGESFPPRKRFISPLKLIAVLLGGFVVLTCFVDYITTGVSIIQPLSTGWYRYLPRALPKAHVDTTAVIFSALCLIVLITGSHRFLDWICRAVNGSIWKLRWTLSVAAVFFLMLLGGMAMMGVAHQVGWLVTSPYHLTERRGDWNCASNMRQIGLAMLLYGNDHGGDYPPDLPTLLRSEQITPQCFVCPSSDDEAVSVTTTQQAAESLNQPGRCSYIYLFKGHGSPEASRVILVEPMRNHGGDGMNVLYGDGHVEWVDQQKAEEIFAEYHVADDGTPLAVGKDSK